MKDWTVYLLKCSDDTYYCGSTNNLDRRIHAHNMGRGAKYTNGRRPVELLSYRSELTQTQALQLEYQVKRQAKARKIHYLNNKSID
ncbi:MAG: hypothetical protein IEMM0008_0240 [bacterium]|nr:MAG: hypothetical protein IEMM0008_0240 [bacterium]